MEDITPVTWVDDDTLFNDDLLNTEIRNTYTLLMNPPTCQVHRAANGTIPVGAWSVITWDTLLIDTEDESTPMYSSGNPTRITIQTPGYYYINAAVGLGNSDTSIIVAEISARVNGSQYYNMGSGRTQFNLHVYMAASTIIALNEGDYLELMATHTSSSTADLMILTYMPMFTVVRWRGL